MEEGVWGGDGHGECGECGECGGRLEGGSPSHGLRVLGLQQQVVYQGACGAGGARVRGERYLALGTLRCKLQPNLE